MLIEGFYLIFIGRNDAVVFGGDNPIDQFADLSFYAFQLFAQPQLIFRCAGISGVPHVFEHGPKGFEYLRRQREGLQQFFKVALHHIPVHGLSAPFTFSGLALVVWVSRACATARPSGGHSAVTAMTGNKTTHDKVFAIVLAYCTDTRLFKAALHFLPCRKINNRRVLGWMKVDIPFRYCDVTRIKRVFEHINRPLQSHFAVLVFRNAGELAQESGSFCWRTKATKGNAFHGCTYDRSIWLFRCNHPTATIRIHILVSEDRAKTVIPAHNPRIHAISNPLGVAAAQVLSKYGVGLFD